MNPVFWRWAAAAFLISFWGVVYALLARAVAP